MSQFYDRYRHKLRTRTRDTSEYGYHYLSGLLRLESKRNMSQIAGTAEMSEQNMQQFISDSPWSGYGLIEQLQQDIGAHAHYQSGSVLLIDESADEKAVTTVPERDDNIMVAWGK